VAPDFLLKTGGPGLWGLGGGGRALERPGFYSFAISTISLLSNAALQTLQWNDGQVMSTFIAGELELPIPFEFGLQHT